MSDPCIVVYKYAMFQLSSIILWIGIPCVHMCRKQSVNGGHWVLLFS